jgi:hypothetical protein
VAFRVGYESPWQFGGEYRRLFWVPREKMVAAEKFGALMEMPGKRPPILVQSK